MGDKSVIGVLHSIPNLLPTRHMQGLRLHPFWNYSYWSLKIHAFYTCLSLSIPAVKLLRFLSSIQARLLRQPLAGTCRIVMQRNNPKQERLRTKSTFISSFLFWMHPPSKVSSAMSLSVASISRWQAPCPRRVKDLVQVSSAPLILFSTILDYQHDLGTIGYPYYIRRCIIIATSSQQHHGQEQEQRQS